MEHSCSCKAGQGICNHKVAFLYQAAHYSMLGLKTVPVIPSKTSLPQEWHKPRTAGVAPECSQEIQLRKPELKLNRGKKCSFDGVKSSLYNPIASDFPPKKFIANLVINTPGYTTVLPPKESIYYAGEQIKLEECKQIEKETRDQSDNPFWYDLRKKRITASKFKRVAARKKDYETLVAQLKKTCQTDTSNEIWTGQ